MPRWWFADWSVCDFNEHTVWRPLTEGDARPLGENPLLTSPCDHPADLAAEVSALLEGDPH